VGHAGAAGITLRVLVLGAAGMLGHKLAQRLAGEHAVFGTVRSAEQPAVQKVLGAACEEVFRGVEAGDLSGIVDVFAAVRPDVALNCIGVIKQVREAKDAKTSLAVNALFPHQLAGLCRATGTRLLHFSTDCVFSGERGGYKESDVADATDLYGRSKLMGEVEGDGCLTVRTSILGRDLVKDVGLLEWFLGRRGGQVRGFRRAVFSGFPTAVLASIVERIITEHPELQGVYHVASPAIDKYDLLVRIRDAMGLDTEIVPDDELVIDRSLNDSRFRAATGFAPPSWAEMVNVLAEDAIPYDEWRA
jgi:dTDP-4-dehydrorhamnose reductase